MTKTKTLPLDPIEMHLLYDADFLTGEIFRKGETVPIKSWFSQGYVIFRKEPWPCPTVLKRNRVMWVLYHNMDVPAGYVIDHEDNNRSNDRIENLKCMTIAENNLYKINSRGKRR